MASNEFEEIKKTLTRIETGLFGDDKAGVTGIVCKVKRHEKNLYYINRILWACGGGVFVISVLWAIFKEFK